MNYEEYIKKFFKYENGKIIREDRKNSNGSLDKDGYLIIKVKGKQFKAHRIVWLLNNGHFPIKEIDHINRIRTDNRIENLREADRQMQAKNSSKKINPDTGVFGISKDKTTKGLKAVFCFRKNKKVYRYRTLEEAMKERGKICKD